MSVDGDAPGRREVAYRLFAAEFDDATLSHSESDEERAPNYVVTPTGARVNRLFAVGVLTEVEAVNDDVLRGRVVDPTGAFVTYAGQYQPEAAAFLERTDPPAFVALTGKARTFEPEDSNRVFTSVRPESINEVDAATRDRWVITAAEATLERIAIVSEALSMDVRGDDLRAALEARGVRESLASGVPLALDHYGTTTAYLDALRAVAIDALELVAGDTDAVRSVDLAPDEGGAVTLGPLPTVVDAAGGSTSASAAEQNATAGEVTTPEPSGNDPSADSTPTTDSTQTVESTTTEREHAPEDEATEAEDTTSETEGADDSDNDSIEADASSGATSDDLGDFDGDPSLSQSSDDGSGGEAADSEPSESPESSEPSEAGDRYELDAAERAAVEEEFGTEFETGSEVSAPGEADIDVPGPEDIEAMTDEAESSAVESSDADDESTEVAVETDEADEDTDEADENPDEADEATDDVDLETVAVEAMETLDDGDGADREAVVGSVVEEYGADPESVEDAIQSALMSGRCYEPGEGSLKAI